MRLVKEKMHGPLHWLG